MMGIFRKKKNSKIKFLKSNKCFNVEKNVHKKLKSNDLYKKS